MARSHWFRSPHHLVLARLAGAVTAVITLMWLVPLGSHEIQPVTLDMTEYAFTPSAPEAAPGTVFEVRNRGAIVHSVYVVGLAKGVELQPGQTSTFRLAADTKAGTYRMVCDLPGHEAAGMVGTIRVTDG